MGSDRAAGTRNETAAPRYAEVVSGEVEPGGVLPSGISPDAAGGPDGLKDDRPFLIRFLDRFLQERNIKWILALGMLILLASSIKLVGTWWNEATAAWRHLILLCYATVSLVAAEVSYWRLGLRKTGTVLMALTIFLVPVAFLGLHFALREAARSAWPALALVLQFAANLGLGWLAASRTFRHLLRQPQNTFAASYLILAAAAAVVPAIPTAWWPGTGILLWCVFVAGVVKANRHVFWLTEEHRLPRIFGFFPILLLTTEYLLLFAWQIGPHMPHEWLGLAGVLVSLPILLTADAVARVFQHRTGNLVRPLPWEIVLPLVAGLALCAAGVIWALVQGLPFPRALVPTAAAAALVMGIAARRTGHAGFAWAMLACTVLAYNFSYVFFRDAAAHAIRSGAQAIHEPRLPYAYYGLTYLPLLAILTAIAARLKRRARCQSAATGENPFLAPLRQFVAGMCVVLLAASFSHSKALLPVALSMTVLFAAQSALLSDRRLVLFGVAAMVSAAWGFVPFVTTVPFLAERRALATTPHLNTLAFCGAALLLLFPGGLVDRWTRNAAARDPQPATDHNRRWMIRLDGIDWCRHSGQGIVLAFSVAWLLECASWGAAPWSAPGVVLEALLVSYALAGASAWLGSAAIILLALLAGIHGLQAGMSARMLLDAAVWLFLTLWGISLALRSIARSRPGRTFEPGTRQLSGWALVALTAYFIAGLATSAVTYVEPSHCLTTALLSAWCLAHAWQTEERACGWLGCIGLLPLAAACWRQWSIAPDLVEWQWLVVAGAAAAEGGVAALLARTEATTHDARLDAIARPLAAVSTYAFVVIGVVSLIPSALPVRLAGVLSAAGLSLCGAAARQPRQRQWGWIIANWQGLAWLATGPGVDTQHGFTLHRTSLGVAALPVAAGAAMSALAFRRLVGARHTEFSAQLTAWHSQILKFVAAGLLAVAALWHSAPLNLLDTVAAACAFALIAADELWAACESGAASRVWSGFTLGLAGVLFLWRFDVISFEHTTALYGILASGIGMWLAGRCAAARPATRALAGPFVRAGMALPLLGVGVGVVQHLALQHPGWLGARSLALLFTAGFYFWRGLEGRRRRLIGLALAVLNVALALLWRELRWSDPQFFMIPLGLSFLGMVELLRRDIPTGWIDPLRYAGALTILVSPTFHIVGGSWLHLVTLLVASIGVALLAMGLQARALMYSAVAFLVADLLAMVVRGGIDHPQIVWIAGTAIGILVLGLGAVCENHREIVLQRLRILAARLEAWS